jgi:hypothetical protein
MSDLRSLCMLNISYVLELQEDVNLIIAVETQTSSSNQQS